MLQISGKQQAAFAPSRREAWLDALADFLTRDRPDLLDAPSSRLAVRERAGRHLDQSLAFGLSDAEKAARFSLYAFRHGDDFAERNERLRAALKDAGRSQDSKLRAIARRYP